MTGSQGVHLQGSSGVRLLLIDSDCMVREGLAALFGRECGMQVVGTGSGGSDTLELMGELRPDVVVVDVSCGMAGGVEIIHRICQVGAETKVVALSTLCNRTLVGEAFKAGANAYVAKCNCFRELVRAIQGVVSGATHLCPHTREAVLDQCRDHPTDNDTQILTDREYAVLELIGEGQTSKEIGLHMNLSSKTIDACRRQLMRKLDVDSVAGLVKHAIVMGLTTTFPLSRARLLPAR